MAHVEAGPPEIGCFILGGWAFRRRGIRLWSLFDLAYKIFWWWKTMDRDSRPRREQSRRQASPLQTASSLGREVAPQQELQASVYPASSMIPIPPYRLSRPPSSSSSSGSGSTHDRRVYSQNECPVQVSSSVAQDRRYYAQAQWVGPEDRRMRRQEPNTLPPLQLPPEPLSFSQRETFHLPPIRPVPYNREWSAQSPSVSHTPTAMQFSKLTTSDARSSVTPPLVGPSDSIPRKVDDAKVNEPIEPALMTCVFPLNDVAKGSIHREAPFPRSCSMSPHQSQYPNPSPSEAMTRQRSRSSSGSSHMEGSVGSPEGTPKQNQSTSRAGVGRGMEKKKRTRALMTHVQQAGLMGLWKKTKFPTTNDREILGQEIGLTSRQVQVWFQNQRQKGRKTLQVNGGVPEGEDPTDYEDLQKSPRSRRLSMEQEERISAWAGSSTANRSALHVSDAYGHDSRERGGAIFVPEGYGHSPAGYPRSDALVDRSPSPYEHWSETAPPIGYSNYPVAHRSAEASNPSHLHLYRRDLRESPRSYTFPHYRPPPLQSSVAQREHGQYYLPGEPPRSASSVTSGASLYSPKVMPPLSGRESSVPPPAAWTARPHSTYGYYEHRPNSQGGYQRGPILSHATSPVQSRRRSVSDEHHYSATSPLLPSISSAPFLPGAHAPNRADYQTRHRHGQRSNLSAGPVSHLPPKLARIAIPGPVAGGDDLLQSYCNPCGDGGMSGGGGWCI
ncbi:uncharacterized protein L203_102494 [Cryptococcus depauperatus CBS 7841]|uniref:Homeobox domain-containing protein n=1 Tax=Cryptococcus depauperatus CBS 7841 TaxID=1295531 RepID=A0AAJ8M161_9TREE